MSTVLGIIAEYNPFHNGHLYHLQKAKKDTSADYSIAIMSGNFTQRGSTSIIDKWAKAQMALENGFDLVIELPLLYAISSAENFADGAVKIMNSLEIVNYLSFGAETSDYETLNKIADILYNEPKEYKTFLQLELKKGLSFPKARQNALISYLTKNISNNYTNFLKAKKYQDKNLTQYVDLLSSPNNILGIEYLKALKKYNSKIIPYPIQRFQSEYNSTSINGNIASSTAIRNIIKNTNFPILKKLLPDNCFSILLNALQIGHVVPDISAFEKLIIYNIRKMSTSEIQNIPDVSEGLEYSLKQAANSCNNICDFLNIIKSKRYTYTRLQRILLYVLLNITKKDLDISKNVTPYVRVLGFNNNGKFLISQISKTNPKLEIITSVKRFFDTTNNKNSKILLEKDILATNVYTLAYENSSLSNLDFTHKIVQ